MSKVGFDITHQKGFHITFENGYTVSFQFGYGNYCDNRDTGGFNQPVQHSRNAECAAWGPDGERLKLSDYDDVIGHQSPAQVLELLNRVASMT